MCAYLPLIGLLTPRPLLIGGFAKDRGAEAGLWGTLAMRESGARDDLRILCSRDR
jgi:hypothetical protein